MAHGRAQRWALPFYGGPCECTLPWSRFDRRHRDPDRRHHHHQRRHPDNAYTPHHHRNGFPDHADGALRRFQHKSYYKNYGGNYPDHRRPPGPRLQPPLHCKPRPQHHCHIAANDDRTAPISNVDNAINVVNHHHHLSPCFKTAPSTPEMTANAAKPTHKPPARSPAPLSAP